MSRNNISFSVSDENKIYDFINKFSPKMGEYMKDNSNSHFYMFYKYITHSDLITAGKATSVNNLHDNLLYYIEEEEMAIIEQTTNRPFQTAHQSNIGLKLEVYEKTRLPNPRDLTNHQYLINDYYNVYVSKDNLKYFSLDYTKKVFNKLNKEYRNNEWNENKANISFSVSDDFQPIQLHCAVHGIGMSEDEDFHKIRHNIFKSDVLIMLFEMKDTKGNLFLLFDKNPVFYNLIDEINTSYLRYQQTLRRRTETLLQEEPLEVPDDITRAQQDAWREMLAREIMGYLPVEGEVMCPFTYIQADWDDLGTLYRASHIKGFSDVNTAPEEKYDINNGLLLCSNADALFDKHLITIGENKELIFSFTLDNNFLLKQKLCLTQPIFQVILNDKRMKYLEYHRNKFYELEQIRQTQQ